MIRMMGTAFGRNAKFFLLLFIAAIALTSGCTGLNQSTSGTGQGLFAEIFRPTLGQTTPIESDEPVTLHLEVVNKGDYNNAPAVAELTGIDTTEWNLYGDVYRDLGLLLAPDPESQTEGGRGRADWDVITPTLPRNQYMTYEPLARVYYYYETRVTKPVWFVTSEELRRIIDGAGSLDSEPTTIWNGPLRVTVDTGRFVKARDWRESKFQLQIRIDNTGGGQIFGKDYPVALEVTWPDGVIPVDDCPRQIQFGTGIYDNLPPFLNVPAFGRFVRVWNGQYTDITCEFQVTNPPTNKVEKNFEVKLGYIYYMDAATSITVKGFEEFV